MADKVRERWYLQRLMSCLRDPPQGNAVDSETPDFLIGASERGLGVEFTEFHLPPLPGCRPHQEVESLRERIVKLADDIHAQSGGPGAYVDVFFDDRVPLTKRDVKPLAKALGEFLLHCPLPSSPTEVFDLHGAELPPGILRIMVWGSVDGTDRLWDVDSGGWIASISPEQTQSVIDRKALMAPKARACCQTLWLVIVHDLFAHSAPSDLSPVARGYVYRHPFDRVLWLEPQGPRVFDLSGSQLGAPQSDKTGVPPF